MGITLPVRLWVYLRCEVNLQEKSLVALDTFRAANMKFSRNLRINVKSFLNYKHTKKAIIQTHFSKDLRPYAVWINYLYNRSG